MTKTFNTNIPETQAQIPKLSNKSNNVKSNWITGFFLDCGNLLDIPGSEDFVWRRSLKRFDHDHNQFKWEIKICFIFRRNLGSKDNHLIHPLSCHIFEKKYIHMNPSLFGEDHSKGLIMIIINSNGRLIYVSFQKRFSIQSEFYESWAPRVGTLEYCVINLLPHSQSRVLYLVVGPNKLHCGYELGTFTLTHAPLGCVLVWISQHPKSVTLHMDVTSV
ncbi:hypothetical protein DFH28DRAFT_1113953 [Melampsora americana]|nr:hypothetical protein DFH28DRAFT_1113953 [Melampsora americana]